MDQVSKEVLADLSGGNDMQGLDRQLHEHPARQCRGAHQEQLRRVAGPGPHTVQQRALDSRRRPRRGERRRQDGWLIDKNRRGRNGEAKAGRGGNKEGFGLFSP